MRAAAVLLGALVFALPVGAMDPRGPQQRHTVTDTQLATSIGLTLRDLPGDWHAANGSLSFDTPEAGAARRKSLLGVARWLAERTIDS